MQSFRFLQFSDMHLFGDATEKLRGVASLPALQAAVADATRRCHNPDGILLTGDLVQDDPNGYRWIREVFGRSRVPVLCLSGNHDVPEQMRSSLGAAPFQVGGEAQFGKWLVVMLDTWVASTASGEIGTATLERLRDVLARHRNHHVLVCLHHQPIAMRSQWLDQVGLRDAEALMTLVLQNSNVRGVLWGHVHQSLDSFVHGVRFMATPSTCAQFLPRSADFAIDNRPPGYRVLELRHDGSIATEVVWLESYAQSSARAL